MSDPTITYRTPGGSVHAAFRSTVYDFKYVNGEQVQCLDPRNDGIFKNGRVHYAD